MSAGHSHEAKKLDSKLKLGLALNTGFTIIEFVAGILSGSLALISDAGHNLTDSLSILITFFGNKIAKREANDEHSYGYGRASILTALLNGVILVLLAGYIFYESFQRIANPEPVEGGIVAIVALIGILINGGVALLFRNDKDDLNVRSAYVNMFFDMLASVGALIAGILIVITGNTIFDPLIGILIGALLIKSSIGVVRDAMHVLLEGVPEGLDVKKVKQSICSVPKVKGVDDLHIWAISSRYAALSCHVIIESCTLEESMKLTETIKDMLHEKFDIDHATIETELTEGPHDKEKMDEGA